MTYFISLGVGIFASLYFCIKRTKGCNVNNVMLKIISSLFFLVTAVFGIIENPDASTYGALILFGGILGLCGDITLDLRGIYEEHFHQYLNSGFLFFLVGHIFYSVAIALFSELKLWHIAVCVGCSIVVSIGNLFIGKLMKMVYGKYKLIVSLYVVFLSTTVFLSLAAMIVSGFTGKYIVLAVGTILFFLSDVVLSGTYFGEGMDGPFFLFINHFLYYAGQYLIASSIMIM